MNHPVPSHTAQIRKSCVLHPEHATELMTTLDRLEGLLVQIAIWEDLDDIVLPSPLAAGRSLDAVRRLWDALAACREEGGALVEVDSTDPRTIAAALAQLRYAATRPATARDRFGQALALAAEDAGASVARIADDGARLLAQAAAPPKRADRGSTRTNAGAGRRP